MREINLNGYIDEEVWYGDEITPALLHEALYGPDNLFADDVHIRMNSYGGSCNAAVRMFDDIRAYPGSVTITISGTAASAATVLSMAADRLEMTPGSLFMIHNPSTIAWGNENDFLEAIQLLRACKESILNCYGVRCSLARDMVAAMMTATTWMDATAAFQHGFIDAVAEVVPGVTNAEGIHTVNRKDAEAKVKAWLERHKPNLSRPSTGNDHTSTVPAASEQPPAPDVEDGTENTKPDAEAIKPSVSAFSMPSCPEGTPVDQLLKRLELIKPIRKKEDTEMSNVSKSLEMRQKRAEIWDRAKNFLNEHTDENGMMSAEDTEQYERMEKEVVDMAAVIDRLERAEQMDREMENLTVPPLASRPQQHVSDDKKGIRSENYKKQFWNHMRGRSGYDIRNALQVGELSEGGYTVPDEFEHTLVEALQEENIMRGLVHVMTTASGDRKIPLVVSKGTASWIEEEAQIPESDDSFGQITLSAHKVGCMIKISSELLHDSAFDMAAYIAHEFGRRVGAAEEEAILSGDGNHKPFGLLHDTQGAQVGVTAAAATALTADELIDLQHSLKSGYRRNAVFVMNDGTIKLLRKLKDGNGNFLWQPNVLYGQPDMLLNTRVLTSNYMPLPTAGNKAILYGDMSYYWLADREGRSLQRLNELYAATDQIGFKITQRLDGRLILPEAVQVLQMKAA